MGLYSVVPVTGANRHIVLQTLRTDFGRLSGPNGEGFPQLAAPARLHVLAELIANAAFSPTTTQFVAAISPEGDVHAVMAAIPDTLVILAGYEMAASALVQVLRRANWRVLIGDEALARATLERWKQRLWWVPAMRERRQLFMQATAPARISPGQDPTYRVANVADVDNLTALSAALHVDDEMGPPLSSGGIDHLRVRVREVVNQGRTWVIEENQHAIAKFDIHNLSMTYGAQLSGVVVHAKYRGKGVGTRLVANGIADLLSVGIPLVTLHLREGNQAAIRAYEKAGMRLVDQALMVII